MMANRGLERHHHLLPLLVVVVVEWQAFNQRHHLRLRLHRRNSSRGLVIRMHFHHRLLLEALRNNHHNHRGLQLLPLLQAIKLLLGALTSNNHNHRDLDNLLPLPIRLLLEACRNHNHRVLVRLPLLHHHLVLLLHLIRHLLVRHLHPTHRLLVAPSSSNSLQLAFRVRLQLQPILPLVQVMHQLLHPLATQTQTLLDLVIRRTLVNHASSMLKENAETVIIAVSHMIRAGQTRAMAEDSVAALEIKLLLRHLETQHHLDSVEMEEEIAIRTIAHLASSLPRANVETEPTVNFLMMLAVGTLEVDLETNLHLLEEEDLDQQHLHLVRLEVVQQHQLPFHSGVEQLLHLVLLGVEQHQLPVHSEVVQHSVEGQLLRLVHSEVEQPPLPVLLVAHQHLEVEQQHQPLAHLEEEEHRLQVPLEEEVLVVAWLHHRLPLGLLLLCRIVIHLVDQDDNLRIICNDSFQLFMAAIQKCPLLFFDLLHVACPKLVESN
mmetsp:Transcript_17988/g.26818  ORF Transcript_17988/g.26818 Transcript_17988/m.26818 type:complete len:491 (+) Transcript_17988:674-2146(+)